MHILQNAQFWPIRTGTRTQGVLSVSKSTFLHSLRQPSLRRQFPIDVRKTSDAVAQDRAGSSATTTASRSSNRDRSVTRPPAQHSARRDTGGSSFPLSSNSCPRYSITRQSPTPGHLDRLVLRMPVPHLLLAGWYRAVWITNFGALASEFVLNYLHFCRLLACLPERSTHSDDQNLFLFILTSLSSVTAFFLSCWFCASVARATQGTSGSAILAVWQAPR